MLPAADREFFEQQGYLLIPGVVPPAQCQAVINAAFDFLGMNPDDPDDWYRPPHSPGGMIEMYQHPALWNNRQWPALHALFADLWKSPALWVSIDRANFKVPVRPDKPGWDHAGFLHLDADTRTLPIPFGLQGVLYLADTSADQGGFRCIPGWHHRTEEWLKLAGLPREESERAIAALPDRTIPGRAGDFLVWHRALPHGNGQNRSPRPRFAQYISMRPAGTDEAARQDRIRRWRERLAPEGSWVLGDPRRWEETKGTTADLTPLGRKLLGLDPWP